jgi:hypothetical protein
LLGAPGCLNPVLMSTPPPSQSSLAHTTNPHTYARSFHSDKPGAALPAPSMRTQPRPRPRNLDLVFIVVARCSDELVQSERRSPPLTLSAWDNPPICVLLTPHLTSPHLTSSRRHLTSSSPSLSSPLLSTTARRVAAAQLSNNGDGGIVFR